MVAEAGSMKPAGWASQTTRSVRSDSQNWLTLNQLQAHDPERATVGNRLEGHFRRRLNVPFTGFSLGASGGSSSGDG
jgi:hypothetical protein